MTEGTIQNFSGNSGRIKGDDGQVYGFNRKAFATGKVEDATPGRRVHFRVEGDRARDVVLLEQVVEQQKPMKTAVPEKPVGPYRFLNPYNFVRWLAAPQVFDAETQLLGRAAPPPHDRYVGLSGKLVCEVENVTPLFIADADADWTSEADKAKDHKTLRFFHVDFGEGKGEEPALPASSLRGMLRSVFEAATNSCYAVFDYDARLSYHLNAAEALKLIPARAECNEHGRLRLRLLPGTANIAINERPREKLYAARLEQYEALAPGRRRTRDGRPNKPQFKHIKLNGLRHGVKCHALVEELKFPPVWNVVEMAQDKSQLRVRDATKQRIVEGYLCVNNQNIEAKRFERFFFRDPSNRSGAEFASLTANVLSKYEDLIRDYQERHREAIKSWKQRGLDPAQPQHEKKEAAYSRFIIDGPTELREGDLVYAMLSGTPNSPTVEYIVPVAVPRLGYNRKPVELLPRHLYKCEEYDKLCPACRTFGWVYGHEESEVDLPIEKQTAYAGRIRITHGRLTSLPMQAYLPETTLAILSSPKPTTTRFYLKPSNNRPQNGQDDYRAGYDNRDNVLRGRKFYRHQGHANDQGYWAAATREYHQPSKSNQLDSHKSDQNRTLQYPLKPGARFQFTIHFESMAPVELGALLWALKLEGKHYHRLGLAKPLGFGSVRLQVTEATILDFASRYSSNLTKGERMVDDTELGGWIEQFKQAMGRAYQQDFATLPHICELLTLLGDPQPDLPIHYPRTDVRRDPEGKNFEWFMGNNRNRDARLVLEMTGEEKGLPLIDKTGDIKR